MIIFKKGEGKENNPNWKWKGDRVEVKEFVYLRNGELTNHIKEVVKSDNESNMENRGESKATLWEE